MNNLNRSIIKIALLLNTVSVFAQDINFSSEYNRVSWPVALGLSGGITGDDGSYKRLALYHGGSISLQTGSNSPGISNSRLFINTTGQVGIGTTNPNVNLQIDGGSGMQNRLRIASPFVGAEARFDITMGTGSDDLAGGMRGYVPLGQPGIDRVFLGFYTTTYQNGTQSRMERMTISDAGNVGIGIASPVAQLHLADIYTAGGKNLLVGDDTYLTDIDVGNVLGIFGNQNNDRGGIKLGSNGPTLFGLNGNLGVGNLNPDAMLTVSGQVHAQEVSTTAGVFNSDNTDLTLKTTGSNRLSISNATGNVGIGTINAPEKLTVTGNIQVPLSNAMGYLISSDKFTHNGNTVGNYSQGWFWDSWQTGAPTGYLSSAGGLKFFTGSNLRVAIDAFGNMGIGTGSAALDAKLDVKGQVHAQEVKIDLSVPGPDYVFEKDYKLTSLEEIKNYIDQNKHLPEVPSAAAMEKNGVQLGEMNMLLLKKIEELTLYVIEQNRRIDGQQNEIKELKDQLKK